MDRELVVCEVELDEPGHLGGGARSRQLHEREAHGAVLINRQIAHHTGSDEVLPLTGIRNPAECVLDA